MPRHAGDNLINMHDIIAQPLGALPDAVSAALRRPEPLVMAEVTGVLEQCAYVLLRASEALSCADAAAFAALMRLLFEALTHSAAAYEQGVQMFALQPAHVHTLHTLFTRAVVQHALPPHSDAAVELVHVLSSLCDAEAMKEMCGALFMTSLVYVLQELYDTAQQASHRDDKDVTEHDRADAAASSSWCTSGTTLEQVALQRAVATALINLVKGSRQNKLRAVSWHDVALCCVRSVDVFFQLQCIELLFRVSRQRRDVLDSAAAVLPHDTAQQLRALPNDATLLQRMTSLVAQMNAGRATVLHYPLREVTIAASTLPAAHDAYFTPAYLVVLVTGKDADHVTLGYDAIRSVTLSKDGRVGLRLDTFPLKLERLLSHVAGMDTVTLHMSVDTLQSFKQSAVRGWVTSVLHARKRAARPSSPHNNVVKQEDKKPTAAAAAAAAAVPPPPQQHTDDRHSDGDATRPRAPTLQLAAHTPPPRAGAAKSATHTATAAAAVAATGGLRLMHMASPQTRSNNTDNNKEDDNNSSSNSRNHPRSHDDDAASNDNSRNDGNSAAAVAQVAVSTVLPQMQKALAQLRRVREAKHELRRVRVADDLGACMQRVQSMVDETRQQAHVLRRSWYDEADAALQRVVQVVADAHDVAATSVQQLNDDLRELKSSNQALNDRLSCAELELQQTLQTSRDREADDARALRALCERTSVQLEHALGEALLLQCDAPAAPPLQPPQPTLHL